VEASPLAPLADDPTPSAPTSLNDAKAEHEHAPEAGDSNATKAKVRRYRMVMSRLNQGTHPVSPNTRLHSLLHNRTVIKHKINV
jgi:hypothetical protein